MPSISVRTSSADETFHYGVQFGRWSVAGDIICLIGDLGAGKTQFTQGISSGLGLVREAVTSPTYSLLAEHNGGRIPLYHMDAYRLEDTSELGPIGFHDYIDREGGIFVIEWADRILSALPDNRVDVRILQPIGQDYPEERRSILIDGFGERANRLISDALAII